MNEMSIHPRTCPPNPRHYVRAGALALALVLLLLTTSACAILNPKSGLTLKQAKSQAQTMETRIADLIPREYVAGRTQAAKGPILQCRRVSLTWSGRTTVTLKSNRDLRRIVDAIAAGMRRENGYEVELQKFSDGTPVAYIFGPYNARYEARLSPDDAAQYDITSYSPCFELPEDTWTGGLF